MTITSTTNRISYAGDAIEDTFPYTFKILAQTELVVYVDGVVKTITTDYTVTGVGEAGGGNVVFVAAPASGTLIEIRRELPLSQLTDYTSGGRFPAETHEIALDRTIMIAQQLLARLVAWPIGTLANSATPSVLNGKTFLTGGTTTITDFSNGVTGQIIRVLAEHTIIITDGTNIMLNGSANWIMVAGDTLTLICKADNKWYELSRGDN